MNDQEAKEVKKAISEISKIHTKVEKHLPDATGQLMIDYLYEVLLIVGDDDVDTFIDDAINWDLEFEK